MIYRSIWKVCRDMLTSSGTALMFVKPFLKMTNTLFAPQRRADVAQSKAVSPAPSTITVPRSSGRDVRLHEHIPVGQRQLNFSVGLFFPSFFSPPLPSFHLPSLPHLVCWLLQPLARSL